MTANPATDYISLALVCSGMLLLLAVVVANIRINLRRRPFDYRLLTVAGAVSTGLFTLGMVIAVWPESVPLALTFIGVAVASNGFALWYSRRLSRRYEEERRR